MRVFMPPKQKLVEWVWPKKDMIDFSIILHSKPSKLNFGIPYQTSEYFQKWKTLIFGEQNLRID